MAIRTRRSGSTAALIAAAFTGRTLTLASSATAADEDRTSIDLAEKP